MTSLANFDKRVLETTQIGSERWCKRLIDAANAAGVEQSLACPGNG